MGDIFKRWQRKAGCAILFLALALTIPWLRSYRDYDCIGLGNHQITSECGTIVHGMFPDHIEILQGWSSGRADRDLHFRYFAASSNFDWRWERGEFIFCGGHMAGVICVFPYWSIVLLLTLVSAYLLLLPAKRPARNNSPP